MKKIKSHIKAPKKARTYPSTNRYPKEVPRDCEPTFKPQAIPKHTHGVSGVEDKVLAMYARGMSQRDISVTTEDIYGFKVSHETIPTITDRVVETADELQNRPLKILYVRLCRLPVCLNLEGDGNKKLCRLCNPWVCLHSLLLLILPDTF